MPPALSFSIKEIINKCENEKKMVFFGLKLLQKIFKTTCSVNMPKKLLSCNRLNIPNLSQLEFLDFQQASGCFTSQLTYTFDYFSDCFQHDNDENSYSYGI